MVAIILFSSASGWRRLVPANLDVEACPTRPLYEMAPTINRWSSPGPPVLRHPRQGQGWRGAAVESRHRRRRTAWIYLDTGPMKDSRWRICGSPGGAQSSTRFCGRSCWMWLPTVPQSRCCGNRGTAGEHEGVFGREPAPFRGGSTCRCCKGSAWSTLT